MRASNRRMNNLLATQKRLHSARHIGLGDWEVSVFAPNRYAAYDAGIFGENAPAQQPQAEDLAGQVEYILGF